MQNARYQSRTAKGHSRSSGCFYHFSRRGVTSCGRRLLKRVVRERVLLRYCQKDFFQSLGRRQIGMPEERKWKRRAIVKEQPSAAFCNICRTFPPATAMEFCHPQLTSFSTSTVEVSLSGAEE
ncbi:Protein of unknown function [Gryllus bimaculatus]|nr:Protein of unknown function [Gryllus bimaculatus]